jgi:two-component system NtrC family sensor kinase
METSSVRTAGLKGGRGLRHTREVIITPRTIRVQIVMAFAVCFIVMGGIIAVSYVNFQRLNRSLQVLEAAEQLNSTILEMRRYEKNYLLYRQDFNFEENVTYTNQLALILQREERTLAAAIGGTSYDNFVRYTTDYGQLMEELHRSTCVSGECDDLRARIRGAGQNLLVLADQLLTTERRAINSRTQELIPLPFLGLLVLVILMGFVVFFIGERVVRPLARITRESEAVAEGFFQRITPYGDSKNEIQILVSAINRMVTELENRQEQLVQSRKIASLGTLSAGIAHEINNPLNNISLILESMLEDAETLGGPECHRLLHDAMDQADRASDIVRNLLEFSRASHPKPEDVNLAELVDKTARLVRNELDLHHISFSSEVRDDLPRLRLEKGGLQQVLLNLFMNSIQAMDDGGELRVVLARTAAGDEARIDVIDTGPGIPPEIRDQIFDPFFTTKKEGVGTGLGLSVSYNIISKNGGRMEVESEPGTGTCFSIFLPLPNHGGAWI